ncbi:hypothetical protein PS918_00642 [Pseudomonas fluorescens]|uniref:Uncharacterized protein n=1 Tax=Pseudomonas fluorescens TaxID=294 RepID=A0A5E7R069_PSEFL|nr:DUF6790 family protein [Pseudomonas fluorescens]VVP67862.1 hypothetical protein PS918_00642 [Pseudomonas fluorescens]
MIADFIRLVLTNIPLAGFLLALLIPTLLPDKTGHRAEQYLSWLLLLSIGFTSLWAGLYHTLAPQTAAAFIGWQVSPFQFEMGVSDIALGVVAMVAFWRSLAFKSAVVLWVVIEFVGLVYGHLQQILDAGNHAPGNAGILLGLTIVHVLLLPLLLFMARRHRLDVAVQPT